MMLCVEMSLKQLCNTHVYQTTTRKCTRSNSNTIWEEKTRRIYNKAFTSQFTEETAHSNFDWWFYISDYYFGKYWLIQQAAVTINFQVQNHFNHGQTYKTQSNTTYFSGCTNNEIPTMYKNIIILFIKTTEPLTRVQYIATYEHMGFQNSLK